MASKATTLSYALIHSLEDPWIDLWAFKVSTALNRERECASLNLGVVSRLNSPRSNCVSSGCGVEDWSSFFYLNLLIECKPIQSRVPLRLLKGLGVGVNE